MKKRKVKVDGEEYEVELEKQNGLWNVTIEGKSFNIEIEGSSVGETSGSKRKIPSTPRNPFRSVRAEIE